MKFVISIILITAIFTISIALGAFNGEVVSFNYLFAKTELRLSVLLAIFFGSGFIVGTILTGILVIISKLQHSSTKRKLNKLQKKYDDNLTDHQKLSLTKTNQE
ncbi:hypothetical protein B5S43_09470 [Gilliamella apicola]|uniref:Probable lipopolysaccharide assembly protein A n=1 Tax=Gilliamella apicola TaxID=1196095 RepID=A0A556SAL8_9GAMM|nr:MULTISPECIES: lipopolysaccharide assembly protein LapA domain-containing protein [Gilliamella]MBI0095606.1 DUF1049 domain-containing protein [Gilliamella sp. W8136]MCT6868076.1 lipopolysaccharide assembly protein LapA domain-containing protein [Gilliamella apicola]OTP98269.1 hypothetical protein B5S43_09470 [Gilliamella apicola]OTQ25147.1 hypothetical protein B6D22_02565 [Gilliamella apicola]TSJ98155.1 DUF1049 domain-containing protein [Gilliamella apicola]